LDLDWHWHWDWHWDRNFQPPASQLPSPQLSQPKPKLEQQATSNQCFSPLLSSSMADVPAALLEALADRYAIDGEIGRGGMATVYGANDLRHGRRVAIKVLRPELSANLGTERFLREIGIAARLTHPHIVPLLDSGMADGMLYYVAQFVTGGSLRMRLKAERVLPVRDALRIAEEIGAGLDFAHRSGIVHRDVKPENILFTDGHAVLTDFGIARTNSVRTDFHTDEGLVVGTPEYMSPEQVSGETNLTGASDIYSLACVVYEMLTGAPPFSGGPSHTIMARHVTEVPKNARILRPEAPEGVVRALARALAKDPAERFAGVGAFVTALEDDPAATIGGRLRSIAVLPFVNASPDPENEYLTDGITDELIDALSKVRGLRVASRTSVFGLKGKVQDIRTVGSLLGASAVIEGTVRRSGDRLRISAQLSSTGDGSLLWSQRFDRTLEDVFALQDEIAHTIVDALRATTFADLSEPLPQRYAGNAKAYGLYLKGRYEWNKRTQDGVTAGIEYFKQAVAEDPRYAPAYVGLADSYALHVDYRSVPVNEGFELAKANARKAIELDESLAEAHASLAWSLFIYDWDWNGAEREFRRAIELAPGYATAHQWFAFLLIARGQIEEALIEAHMAQELDPASVSIRRGLGGIYAYARRYEQSRYHTERAIALNPLAEESYRLLAMALFRQGRAEEAERVLRESSALPGAGPYAEATLGYVLAQRGKVEEARAICTKLEETAKKGYVSPVAFGTLSLGLGQWDSALEWIQRSIDERRGWFVYARVNPIFDPIRDHPRFQEMLRELDRQTG
jgi:serine/threonine protein kinase/tetratricopeptide (TPR) repeat protein